jgi:hypothetical protein
MAFKKSPNVVDPNSMKSKGGVEIKLGSKSFFTPFFHNVEDCERIFENFPYLFNSACLYFHLWIEKFSPTKAKFTIALVWILLYSLPQKYWDP